MAAVFSEPLTAFRFLVEVEHEGSQVVAAFSGFSGVKMRVKSVDYRSGSESRGVLDAIPALTSFENVKLTRGVIGDDGFLDWILSTASGTEEPPTGKDMARTINIAALDSKGRRTISWVLFDAVPVAYELGEMDAMTSAVLSETIEFGIGGFMQEVYE
jgi:phage tail-like protein